ncbi:MAG: hypothetical protein ACK526_17100 [Planctomyces sp.]
MTGQNFLRRSFAAAAIVSIPFTTQTVSSAAQGSGAPGNQSNGTSGNTTVVSELNKIFTENGQEMPSMRASDLPNGNVHRVVMPPKQQSAGQPQKAGQERVVSQTRPGQTRPGQTTPGQTRPGQQNQVRTSYPSPGGPQNGSPQNSVAGPANGASQQNSERPKKNPFQKMMGKIRSGTPFRNSGNEPAENAGSQPGAPNGPGLSSYSAPPPTNPGQQVRPGQPARPGQPSAAGSRVVNSPSGQPRPGNMGSGPGNVPQVPGVPQQGSRLAQNGSRSVTSGGSNPSRMPGQVSSVPPVPIRKDVDKFAPIQPAPVAPPSDDFVDPFEDSGSGIVEADEPLDLDSISAAAETRSPAVGDNGLSHSNTKDGGGVPMPPAVPTQGSEEVGRAVLSEAGVPLPDEALDGRARVDDSEGNSSVSADSTLAVPDTASDPAATNPFTGVRIDVAGEEYIEGDSQAELNVVVRGESAADGTTESDSDLSIPDSTSGQTPGTSSLGVDETSEETGRAVVYPPQGPTVASEKQAVSLPTEAAGAASVPQAVPSRDNGSNEPAGQSSTADAVSIVPSTVTAETAEITEERTPQDVRREEQQRKLESRKGQAGFKGFCPVCLRNRRELVDATTEFSSRFGLREYTFSDAATKEAFDAAPAKYAPAAGGSDVVLLVNSGEEQPGSLDHCLWYHDRLYMFRSQETMNLFAKDPARYASQY